MAAAAFFFFLFWWWWGERYGSMQECHFSSEFSRACTLETEANAESNLEPSISRGAQGYTLIPLRI